MIEVSLPWALVNAMDPHGAPITHMLFHKEAAAHLINALQAVWDTAQTQCTENLSTSLSPVTEPVLGDTSGLQETGSTRALIHSFGGDLWCGTYNLRFVRGYETQGILSPHAYGIAIDINAAHNPMGKPRRTTFPNWYIECWKDHGFLWGGDFTNRPDTMHFEVI
jgi:hypothetical protein